MAKYRKIPVTIDAIQWNGNNEEEIMSFVGENCEFSSSTSADYDSFTTLIIHTLEGDMSARIGDYIIRGVEGEFYPCRRDIFERTYELAE